MIGYRTLLSEKEFLKVRTRARALSNGTDLVAILYKERQIIFKTSSGTYGNRVQYIQTVEITDAYLENIQKAKTFKSVEDLVKNSGLKINCTCMAWLYWGYKYMAWKRGYGLKREIRRPVVRNPYERGYVCFVAGTPIQTPQGLVPIENVKVGDSVYTHTGRIQQVIETNSRDVDYTIKVTFFNTSNHTVQCTDEHPFLTYKSGELQWVAAANLSVGDLLVSPTKDEYLSHVKVGGVSYYCSQVLEVTSCRKHCKVYNVSVEGDESYLAEGVAVHNCKHLYLVLSTYPFYAKFLAKKFIDWSDKKKARQPVPKTTLPSTNTQGLQPSNETNTPSTNSDENSVEEEIEQEL